MNKLTFIKASAVRKHVNARGRRLSPNFLRRLDGFIARKLNAACAVHNGGRTTLDLSVAEFAGITD